VIVRCTKCGTVYDDAARWTLCPHGPLGGGNRYCATHDLDPCPFCDPTATNPLVRAP
jgi:predicted  nucleic acid-binding Zn-ribbon protein